MNGDAIAADGESAPVELRPDASKVAGAEVDDLHPVEEAELDCVDPQLLADVERPVEARVDLVRDHAQAHHRACIRPVDRVAVVTGASGVRYTVRRKSPPQGRLFRSGPDLPFS